MDFNWLDLTTYFANNGFGIVVFTATVGLVSLSLLMPLIIDDFISLKTSVISFVSATLTAFVVSSVICLMPSHEKILEVKIEKIKNEAVTKENISQGVETFERVLKKIECKYLECEGEKGE